MKTIKIPIASLESSAKYFRGEAERYENLGSAFVEMRHWCEGMARAYESIIEQYGQEN